MTGSKHFSEFNTFLILPENMHFVLLLLFHCIWTMPYFQSTY